MHVCVCLCIEIPPVWSVQYHVGGVEFWSAVLLELEGFKWIFGQTLTWVRIMIGVAPTVGVGSAESVRDKAWNMRHVIVR